MKDLTTSTHDRQNILNNRYALEQAQNYLNLGGSLFDNELVFTKQQVADLFDISDATIERYLSKHTEELKSNGYKVLKGKKLKEFKQLYHGTLIHEGTTTSVIGLFNFRALINLSMLLTESEKAKVLRSRLLDIVIDVITQKAGGHTKYINQRDEDFLLSAIQEENYRKKFTDAVEKYIDGSKWRYSRLTNIIYQTIFQENATEYKKILNLENSDNLRDTLYSEVLNLIASFESGISEEIEKYSVKLGRKLTSKEAEELIIEFGNHSLFVPLIFDVRTKMASRDLCFRDALHHKLEAYIRSVPETDFDKFLGEKSLTLEERLSNPETLNVLKRLKDR